jgi:hypothetical protein
MTPLIFTSFLLSLALVDLRHSALRAHYHADAADATTGTQPSRLPGWLHRVVYRYRPYRYHVVVDERVRAVGEKESKGEGQGGLESPGSVGSPAGSPGSGREVEVEDYYHSKQRELMRMEVSEAFEIRGWVVLGLGLVGLGVLWVGWRVLSWVLMVVYYGC